MLSIRTIGCDALKESLMNLLSERGYVIYPVTPRSNKLQP